MSSIHTKPDDDDEDDLSSYTAAAPSFSGGNIAPAPMGMNLNNVADVADVDTDLRNMQRDFSSNTSPIASIVPTVATAPAPMSAMTSDSEKLDYIIRILDERQVGTPTDDVVMYAILGVCAIYVVDGLMR